VLALLVLLLGMLDVDGGIEDYFTRPAAPTLEPGAQPCVSCCVYVCELEQHQPAVLRRRPKCAPGESTSKLSAVVGPYTARRALRCVDLLLLHVESLSAYAPNA
jgi:hypothetical protein